MSNQDCENLIFKDEISINQEYYDGDSYIKFEQEDLYKEDNRIRMSYTLYFFHY